MNAQRRRPTFLGLFAVTIKAIRSQDQAFNQGQMGIHTNFGTGFQGFDFVSPAQTFQTVSRHSQSFIAAMQGIHPIRGLLLLQHINPNRRRRQNHLHPFPFGIRHMLENRLPCGRCC